MKDIHYIIWPGSIWTMTQLLFPSSTSPHSPQQKSLKYPSIYGPPTSAKMYTFVVSPHIFLQVSLFACGPTVKSRTIFLDSACVHSHISNTRRDVHDILTFRTNKNVEAASYFVQSTSPVSDSKLIGQAINCTYRWLYLYTVVLFMKILY